MTVAGSVDPRLTQLSNELPGAMSIFTPRIFFGLQPADVASRQMGKFLRVDQR